MQTTDGNNLILRADQPTGTSGKGLRFQYWNGAGWKNALYFDNVTSSGYTNLIMQSEGGNVGIGTNSPASKLSIGQTDNVNEGGQIDLHSSSNAVKWSFDVFKEPSNLHSLRILEDGSTVRLQVNAGGSSWSSISDARLKNVLNTWESDDHINFVEYQWKNNNSSRSLYGYLAQDVQKVFPAAVSEGQDGMLAVDYTEVHSFKISNLERKNSDQEKRIKELEQTVEELKKMIKRKRTRR